jgi:hypothetical protein
MQRRRGIAQRTQAPHECRIPTEHGAARTGEHDVPITLSRTRGTEVGRRAEAYKTRGVRQSPGQHEQAEMGAGAMAHDGYARRIAA